MKTTPERGSSLRGLVLLVGVVVAWVGMPTCYGAAVDTSPVTWTANPPDNPAQCTVGADGAVAVAFGDEPQPPDGKMRLAGVMADYGVPSSPFSGDFLAARVRGVRFRIAWDGQVPSAYVTLRGPTRTWYGPIASLSPTSSVAALNNASLDIRDGWSTSAKADTQEKMWTSDLKDVRAFGVVIFATNRQAQTCSVDSFVLVGDNGVAGPAANLAPVQRQILLERFGVLAFEHVQPGQKTGDTDKDGLTDYQEAVVGTDWKDANDTFKAEIRGETAAGVTIRWRCVAGGTYNILSADDIAGQFEVLDLDSVKDFVPTVEEAQTGYMVRNDPRPIGAGPRFYRVVKK